MHWISILAKTINIGGGYIFCNKVFCSFHWSLFNYLFSNIFKFRILENLEYIYTDILNPNWSNLSISRIQSEIYCKSNGISLIPNWTRFILPIV